MPADHDAPKRFPGIQAGEPVPTMARPPQGAPWRGEMRVNTLTPASAAPEDEERFVALQETDERYAVLLADLDRRVLWLEQRPVEQTWGSFARSLLSRKFLLTVLAGAIAVVGALGGVIPAGAAATIVGVLAAIYTAVEGYADAGERKAAASTKRPE